MVNIFVVIYLDNILIYSDNLEKHNKHIQEVLQCFRIHGLYACTDKCKFYSNIVEYLSYVLYPKGLQMSSNKVKTILEWPEP